MRILLLHDVPSVGQRNEIVNVRDGFARNYLIAKKLAIFADEKAIEHASQKTVELEAVRKKRERALENVEAQLATATFSIAKKANKSGVLFDSVNAKDIVRLFQQRGFRDITEHHLVGGLPIKTVGVHAVMLKLSAKAAPIDITVHEES